MGREMKPGAVDLSGNIYFSIFLITSSLFIAYMFLRDVFILLKYGYIEGNGYNIYFSEQKYMFILAAFLRLLFPFMSLFLGAAGVVELREWLAR